MRFAGLLRRRRRVSYGSLRRLTPISDRWGLDRGTPVDRHYIEQFLGEHSGDVRGRVLEIGDLAYTRKFGSAVERADVFDVDAGNPNATIVGDLSQPDALPEGAFDCEIVTQTLHLIYDFPAALATLRRGLKPGGVLLLTVPGITRKGADHDYGTSWHWSFTSVSAQRMFEDAFGADAVTVSAHGNVLAAISFLHGIAAEELDAQALAHRDPRYEVIVAVRASAA
jgi:SAM-dependent methyltransferase